MTALRDMAKRGPCHHVVVMDACIARHVGITASVLDFSQYGPNMEDPLEKPSFTNSNELDTSITKGTNTK